MSAFLGKIHYWLYNKIQLQEKLISDVTMFAKSKGNKIEIDAIIDNSTRKYGQPVTGELENQIDHSNIHGWLQGKINSVEFRLAYVITEILKRNLLKKEDIATVFKENAVLVVRESGINTNNPKELFNLIFDNILEGMPCDRVNEIIVDTDNFISWKTSICLHKDYWDEASGDIENYYDLRSAWINGFLSESKSSFVYERTKDAVSTIKRV